MLIRSAVLAALSVLLLAGCAYQPMQVSGVYAAACQPGPGTTASEATCQSGEAGGYGAGYPYAPGPGVAYGAGVYAPPYGGFDYGGLDGAVFLGGAGYAGSGWHGSGWHGGGWHGGGDWHGGGRGGGLHGGGGGHGHR